MPYRDIVDAIGHTPLVELTRFPLKKGVRLFAKLEGNNPTGSVKDRIARYMLEEAEQQGKLAPGGAILEATSGNTGISLAFLARRKGYKLTVVLPENVSQERIELLRLYGTEIVFSPADKGTNGAVAIAEEMARDPRYFMPYQFGNPANPRAHYETTAEEILEELPQVDVFVAGLGTGGTLMGVGRRLKEHDPRARVIAVAPNPGDTIEGLRSLEEGFIPPILDISLLDRRTIVDSRESIRATRELTEREGIFAGISSGAVISCALKVAQQLEKGNIVALLADGGWKYLSTQLWTRPLEEIEPRVQTQPWW
ncbi:MAG: cysteine synthase family protein [Chloroflexi bacterium]|nr:cysteine synthase family protein [Chloroflexota bacterium]